MNEFNPFLNRIVCAANLYGDGTIIVGARHFDSVMRTTMSIINPDISHWKKLGHEQGFIDKFGNFRSREEAKKIAEEAGQIVRRCGGDETELFSENLY